MPSYNGYTLPYVETISKPIGARLRTADSAGRGGAYSQGGLLASKRITIAGTLPWTAEDTLDELWDELNAHLPVGSLLPLVVEPGRSYLAEVESVSDKTNNGIGRIQYEIVFLVPSGYSESDTETSVTLNIAGAVTAITPGGNEAAQPVISLVVSAAPTGGQITVSNVSTGQSITLAPTSTGTYLIDTANQTITKGGVDVMAIWTMGDFPRLRAAGMSNDLYLIAGGGLTLFAASLTFRPRNR